MPYCYVNRHRKVSGEFSSATASDGDIKIFYRKYGRGRTKVLLIIGLAGTHEGWGPQVKGLTGTEYHNEEEEFVVDDNLNGLKDEEEGVQVCCFDNRGMGRSTAPVEKSEYSTKIMANDTLALLDHLGWKKAHVFGHSMGGMIACKLAAVAPDRLCSLALLNVTGGGFECFPKMDLRMMSLLYRFLRAKTPEQRALVDLDTHYTKEYLKERLGSSTRGEMLYQEYVNGISSSGMQSNYGFDGQINACWTHNMSSKELDLIRASGFLVLILHGRHDIIAQVSHARKLAGKLHPASRMVELHGAHLVSHERPKEVNCSLLELIKATESNISIHEWSSFTQQCQDETGESILPTENDNNETNISTYIYNFIRKLQVRILYILGLFVIAFKHTKNAFRFLKPRFNRGIKLHN